ncbi:cupin domain-containing protein [Candidiatus Paracoxiella cheracis]|uniref:cupin domain-containing protein n=1 Tax=Candidiatus Paracoxiella cheracis TaxID=3405120 RepID=UPI003BF4B5C0
MRYLLLCILACLIPNLSFALNPAGVTPKLLNVAAQNTNWKVSFVTAEHGQVVFMNVSPITNPKNEIGSETHKFDQMILIVQGRGKAVLDGKTSTVTAGDMIFIPEGTVHNVINLTQKPLKLISFYSDRDMPANTVYAKKSDDKE